MYVRNYCHYYDKLFDLVVCLTVFQGFGLVKSPNPHLGARNCWVPNGDLSFFEVFNFETKTNLIETVSLKDVREVFQKTEVR